MNVSRWLIYLCLLGALGLSSCVAGDLSIELVPSVGQTLTNVDLLTFKVTGPGLQEEPGTFDVNFSSGTATLPQLILDKNAVDKRISVRAFAYRNSEKIVAIGATDYTIRPEAGQILRVLISQTEKFGWLTDLDSSKKSELPYELVGHQAVPLNDGRVLLVGGTIYFREDKGIFTLRSVDDLLRQILIYDPQTGRINVDSNAQLSTPRVFHTATLLDDGRVLIAGGIGYFNKTPAPIGTVEIYDPKTGTIESQNTPLQKPRAFHTATKMPDGSVVFVGGLGNVLNPNDSKSWTGQLVLTIEQYNTESNQSIKVTDLKSENGRFLHRATAFSNNTILITGGMQFVGDNNNAKRELTQKSLLIQKGSQGWRITTTLEGNASSTPRYDHTSTLIKDGDNEWVVVTGGRDTDDQPFDVVEAWSRDGKLVSFSKKLNTPRYGHTAVLLPNNQLLIAGGMTKDRNTRIKPSELIPFTISGSTLTLKTPVTNNDILEENGRYRTQVVLHPHSKRLMYFGGGYFLEKSGAFVGLRSVEFFTPAMTEEP